MVIWLAFPLLLQANILVYNSASQGVASNMVRLEEAYREAVELHNRYAIQMREGKLDLKTRASYIQSRKELRKRAEALCEAIKKWEKKEVP